MARMKAKEMAKMSDEEIKKRIEDLWLELVKARVAASKTGSSKVRQIKRMIARFLTAEKNHKSQDKMKKNSG